MIWAPQNFCRDCRFSASLPETLQALNTKHAGVLETLHLRVRTTTQEVFLGGAVGLGVVGPFRGLGDLGV